MMLKYVRYILGFILFSVQIFSMEINFRFAVEEDFSTTSSLIQRTDCAWLPEDPYKGKIVILEDANSIPFGFLGFYDSSVFKDAPINSQAVNSCLKQNNIKSRNIDQSYVFILSLPRNIEEDLRRQSFQMAASIYSTHLEKSAQEYLIGFFHSNNRRSLEEADFAILENERLAYYSYMIVYYGKPSSTTSFRALGKDDFFALRLFLGEFGPTWLSENWLEGLRPLEKKSGVILEDIQGNPLGFLGFDNLSALSEVPEIMKVVQSNLQAMEGTQPLDNSQYLILLPLLPPDFGAKFRREAFEIAISTYSSLYKKTSSKYLFGLFPASDCYAAGKAGFTILAKFDYGSVPYLMAYYELYRKEKASTVLEKARIKAREKIKVIKQFQHATTSEKKLRENVVRLSPVIVQLNNNFANQQ